MSKKGFYFYMISLRVTAIDYKRTYFICEIAPKHMNESLHCDN